MDVLVIGSGGREHALAWKLAQSARVDRVLVAPGNAGTAREPGVDNVDVAADDLDGLVELARTRDVGLTVVGPEAPLAAGVVDRFAEAGLKCFGPSADAARLESSKAFAKRFLSRHEIPTAAWTAVETVDDGMEFAHGHALPLVLKADGLAAGKGVVIAEDLDTVRATLQRMLSGDAFGAAGQRVVIEEFLVGEEASFIALVDGSDVLPLATSQDHKQRDDGDKGPNTGGMGAISPAPVIDDELHRRIVDEIIRPTAEGMVADGHPFTGFLYAGLMVTRTGARVLEFNVRLGDPETQPILMRLRSDLAEALLTTLDGGLAGLELDWNPRPAIGVVMAAGGYPDAYRKGDAITGLDLAWPEEVKVFHAGTRLDEHGRVVTAGGRVLCVTSIGDTLRQARGEVYRWLPQIGFRDVYYRTDIGHRALARADS
jgi:phosphoribosylamine--glycine ligase